MTPIESQSPAVELQVEETGQAGDDTSLEHQFRILAAQWEAEVAPLSSMRARTQNQAYLKIIGLGPGVIPLLLRELEQRPNHWFAALRSLTGEDPVMPSEGGQLELMAGAWLKWGRARGLL